MSNINEVIVDESGRLDQLVSKAFKISRSQAIKHIRNGLVLINNERATKASKRLKPGDTVQLSPHENSGSTPSPSPSPSPIHILYEDDSCFVVDKPADLIVHPTGTMDSAESTLLCDLIKQKGGTPALVHRLDRGTTGCLLVAKSPEICEKLQEQFKDRSVKKKYLAICAGVPEKHSAKIEAEIGRSLINRTKMSLFRTSKSRPSSTTYKVISFSDKASLLECDLHTGRTHQIRVHLSGIGHPLIGDSKYANEKSNKLSKDHGVKLPCLHARSLTFHSPSSNKEVHTSAPIPESFKNTANLLELNLHKLS
jgi:23S rRNA pseudouridine1911/1915/1917 synthase